MPANRTTITHAVPAALGAGLLVIGAAAAAAVPVEESVAEPRDGYQSEARSTSAGPSADSGQSTGLASLFYELQVLKREVQDLRGMLEEQGHRLDRLARDQQEQYLDLDRRMQALRGGSSGSAGSQGRPEPAGPVSGTGGAPPSDAEPFAGTPSAGAAPLSERETYTAAFELMKQRQFEASATAFNRLVIEYPNGAYTPNAFYWLGELYLAQEENEQARQSFAQVVNLYPDHQKVPDALYKLGVVYHRLGDLERARQYLNRVRTEYPGSSAAGLAQTYLAEL